MNFYKALILVLFTILFFSCKSPEPRRPITNTSSTFFKESVKRNKLIFAQENEAISKIIALDSSNTYINSNNGFWYSITKKDTLNTSLKKATFGDRITYQYNVTTLRGTLIYTKTELGTLTYVMEKEKLFSGLREGLKLMKEGEHARFIFPSQKAYGFNGDRNKIGPNTPIVCNVILDSIQFNN